MAYVASGGRRRGTRRSTSCWSAPSAPRRVRRELVDRVEHEGAQDRDAAADDRDVRAEIGEQLDLSLVTVPSFSAARVSFCHWSRPWWPDTSDSSASRCTSTGLPSRRPTAQAIHPPGHLELAAEAAADVGGDDADLRLRYAGRGGQGEAQDVRDLGGRVHRTARRWVDDDRARLHERRDEPLLAVLALDHDAVAAGLADRVLDGAAGAGLAGVEDPAPTCWCRRGRGARDGVGGGVLRSSAAGSSSYLDVDELGGVAGLGGARATTTATISPAKATRSLGIGEWLGVTWSGVIGQALMQTPSFSPKSAPVSTATTLVAWRGAGVDAGDGGVREGLRTMARCSIPGSVMLSVQRVRPVMRRWSSQAAVAADLALDPSEGRSCVAVTTWPPSGRVLHLP